MRFFPIRFRRLSTFCLLFAETPILTISMAMLCQAIMTNFSKIAIMAIFVWVDMAINMVNMNVSAKNWQTVDCLWKRIGKNHIGCTQQVYHILWWAINTALNINLVICCCCLNLFPLVYVRANATIVTFLHSQSFSFFFFGCLFL